MTHSAAITVNFAALGCAKNLVDSEKMLGLLAEDGIVPVSCTEPADVTIINTCGFIEAARQEACGHIEAALEAKEQGQTAHVIVAGCLAQLWAAKLTARYPDIDAVVGLADRANLPRIIRELVATAERDGPHMQPRVIVGDKSRPLPDDRARLRLTSRCWAYLRISEGCNRGCSFCTIPAIRGRFRSKKPRAIRAEAEELVADGARELNLIGQETTAYGQDLGSRTGLVDILRSLETLPELRWVRVLYAHPASVTDQLIAAWAECDKVVPYLDLPLQHINDRILKLMQRHIDRAQTERLIQRLRSAVPGLTLRTTMLVGFPSETEAEFEELLDFVRQQRFDALGCFAYSREDQTPAGRMAEQVPAEVKQERLDRLMRTQQQIAFAHADTRIGSTLDCLLIEEISPRQAAELRLDGDKRWFRGRHSGQAPEIDSVCFLSAPAEAHASAGQMRAAHITGRVDYDLMGRLDTPT